MVMADSHLRIMANADGAVILDTRQGTISMLNPAGAYVWEALDRGEGVEAIVANLALETREHVDTLERDVREFIAVLKAQQLFVS